MIYLVSDHLGVEFETFGDVELAESGTEFLDFRLGPHCYCLLGARVNVEKNGCCCLRGKNLLVSVGCLPKTRDFFFPAVYGGARIGRSCSAKRFVRRHCCQYTETESIGSAGFITETGPAPPKSRDVQCTHSNAAPIRTVTATCSREEGANNNK